MPLLYSLGQHGALVATQEELADEETLVAYLDDIWVVSPVPERVSHAYGPCSAICFPTHGFESMAARHRFGTGVESDLRDVMRWRGSRGSRPDSPCLAWVW